MTIRGHKVISPPEGNKPGTIRVEPYFVPGLPINQEYINFYLQDCIITNIPMGMRWLGREVSFEVGKDRRGNIAAIKVQLV